MVHAGGSEQIHQMRVLTRSTNVCICVCLCAIYASFVSLCPQTFMGSLTVITDKSTVCLLAFTVRIPS